jgi:hypothetical protein
MSPARLNAGVIKEDIRIVIVAWVGYSYLAYDATPVAADYAKVSLPPGSLFIIEAPILLAAAGKRPEIFLLKDTGIYYIALW